MKQMLVILIALTGISCATAPTSFQYEWFYYDPPTAVGASAEHDFPLSDCVPDKSGHKCVIMKKPEFERLYQDYISE